MEITGKKIAEYRESLGWTQQKLADYLNISRETLSRYESNESHSIRNSIKKKIIDFMSLSTNGSPVFEQLPISGYYKIAVPFVSAKSYQDFIKKDELEVEKIEFVLKNKSMDKFIAFEIDTKSMDNNSRYSLSEYDIVLTKEVDKDKFNEEYESGEIWIIMLNNAILCRKIEYYNREANEIDCKPINTSPDFSNLIMNFSSVRRFYKVIKRITDIT